MSVFLGRSFTRDEAIQLLGIAPDAVDAFVRSGQLRPLNNDGQQLFAAEQFEALFRDGLLALYRAVAIPPEPYRE